MALVYLWPNLDSVPSLCNAAVLMARRGYRVEIHTYSGPGYTQPAFDEPGIEVVLLKTDALLKRARHTEWYPSSEEIASIGARHRELPYVCFLGVDPEGLVRAGAMAEALSAPFLYYSLELLLASEVNSPWLERLKREEIALSRRAGLVVIQDERRAELLAADNGLSRSRVVLVPNSPMGPARRRKGGYWHSRFNLDPNCRVVLHAGSVAPWTGIREIAASADSWPEGWALIVHSRAEAGPDEEMLALEKLARPGRVFLSPRPVARRDYDELIDSADLGLAFYVPIAGSPFTQDNILHVGLSSGKLAFYLRSGLPVMVNEAGLLAEFVRKEGCGVVVGDAGGVGEAIRAIAADYDSYSRRAGAAFESQLDFARNFEPVLDALDGLARRG